MTRPGGPQQYPPQGWQHPAPQPGQQYPQQYAQQHPQPWGPPPPQRGRKGGVLIGVLITLLVVGLAGGGFWLYTELESDDAPPPVDSSQDLDKAPIGCAMLDEEEVAPYIPGRMDYEPGSANPGPGEYQDQGQCNWNNPDFIEQDVRPAFVIVTSYVYHANQELSGVDKAKEHLESRVRNGVAVNVEDADEALLVQNADADHAASVTVRYRNVVYDVNYQNQTEGANVKGGATELATVALSKVVPGDDD